MDINKVTPQDVDREVSGWLAYLNEVVGVMCFSLGIGALGTPNPMFYAGLSAFFVCCFHFPNMKRKAKLLNALAFKKDKTEHEKFILGEIRSKISVSRALVVWVGYLFLLFIASAGVALDENHEIYRFIYGSA